MRHNICPSQWQICNHTCLCVCVCVCVCVWWETLHACLWVYRRFEPWNICVYESDMNHDMSVCMNPIWSMTCLRVGPIENRAPGWRPSSACTPTRNAAHHNIHQTGSTRRPLYARPLQGDLSTHGLTAMASIMQVTYRPVQGALYACADCYGQHHASDLSIPMISSRHFHPDVSCHRCIYESTARPYIGACHADVATPLIIFLMADSDLSPSWAVHICNWKNKWPKGGCEGIVCKHMLRPMTRDL